MELNIHHAVLGAAFAMAAIMGAVVHRTHFCTMGAVSDWVNFGDSGRLRAWLLAIAVAMLGLAGLEASGLVQLDGTTFPPYRSPEFNWARHVAGGLMFGTGMTLASGCGNRTLVRLGAGNLKSLVVLAVAAACAYLFMWGDGYARAVQPLLAPLSVDLTANGKSGQTLGDLFGMNNAKTGLVLGVALLAAIFANRQFRRSPEHLLGGLTVGLAVAAAWYLTAGAPGLAWQEWAQFADQPPQRVAPQSYTFISPLGDTVHWLGKPLDLRRIDFGMLAAAGVVFGGFVHALFTRTLRFEWFASGADVMRHVCGAALMGSGGVIGLGCTIGQGVSGVSTLALGSFLTLAAIITGAAATMKFEYWRLMRAV
ncbi:MAG: YeeE/YedE family protein [Rhodocyclaceae bacterium]|nr:YeeE/YedE family protein [Rhodocyclaceae bacterium]MBX3670424.1 YeeE/YedE family protein [Rhodocyclaceae bacterium]